MIEYRFAKPEDRRDILDFIDLVFSKNSVPHDFATLLPKVYGEDAVITAPHALAVENGHILGNVAVMPFSINIAGHLLKGGYVGSVSVHPSCRRSGIMRRLMEMQIEKAKADGLQFLSLGGQRQRYGYYGFSPCGVRCRFSLNTSNVRHALRDQDDSAFSFAPTVAGSDEEKAAYRLFNSQKVCGTRTEKGFTVICRSFKMEAVTVLYQGSFAGYVTASEDRTDIGELFLIKPEQIPAMIKAWFRVFGIKNLNISIPQWDSASAVQLVPIAEGVGCGSSGLTRVLDPEAFWSALLDLKAQLVPLRDGCLKIRLTDFDKTLAFTVKDGKTSVCPTEAAPDMVMSAQDALRELTTPWPQTVTVPGMLNWFPLPYALPSPDTF